MTDNVDIFLTHYGVMGMKWGVRKEESKERLARNNVGYFQRAQTEMEASYLKEGSSKAEAKAKAIRNAKVLKVLAITAGVAVTAAVAYVAHKKIVQHFTKTVLAKGSTLQYVHAITNDLSALDLDRRLYTTFLNSDKNIYRGMFTISHLKGSKTNPVFETTLRAAETIKAPSHWQAKKLYNQWRATQNDVLLNKQSYSSFNKDIVYNTSSTKKFLEFVKEKGYNALLDSNDQFISSYKAKKPLILLNAKSTVVAEGQKVVNLNKAKRLYTRQMAGRIASAITTQPEMATYWAIGSATVAGIAISENRSSKTKFDAVDTYLKEHPNSNYTRAELYNKLRSKGDRYYVYGAKD